MVVDVLVGHGHDGIEIIDGHTDAGYRNSFCTHTQKLWLGAIQVHQLIVPILLIWVECSRLAVEDNSHKREEAAARANEGP
jgi:hypothetical protein